MKISWLMEQFMQCADKPVKIRMGRIVHEKYLKLVSKYSDGDQVMSGSFMGADVVRDYSIPGIEFVSRCVIVPIEDL